MKYVNVVNKGIASLTKQLLISMFMTMLFLVILQVVFRYILHIPIPWSEELARYLFTWVIFLGASLASASDEHLSIGVFRDLMTEKYREITIIVINIIIIIFLYILLIKSIDLVLQIKSTKTPVLQISMAFPYSSVLFGSAFMLFHTVVNTINRVLNLVKQKSN